MQGDYAAARKEQAWKGKVSKVFSEFTGKAERTVYRKFDNVDLGGPRRPAVAMDAVHSPQLFNALGKLGFWDNDRAP